MSPHKFWKYLLEQYRFSLCWYDFDMINGILMIFFWCIAPSRIQSTLDAV